MKNQQKGFILPLLIVIIALVVIGSGAYVYKKNKEAAQVNTNNQVTTTSQTTNSTASTTQNTEWATYAKYNFSVVYPTHIMVKEEDSSATSLIVNTVDFYATNSSKPILSINIYNNGDLHLGTRDWKDLTIANNKFIISCDSNSDMCEIIPQVTANAKFEYVIDATDPNADQTVRDMLTSFRFTASSNLTSAQIYQEVSSQLSLPSKLEYFRIWGQDRVQYNYGLGTNYAYKLDGKWYLVGQGNYQDLAECSEYSSVPEKYNPGCYTQSLDTVTMLRSAQYMYLDNNVGMNSLYGQSINYPPSQMISYIGQ